MKYIFLILYSSITLFANDIIEDTKTGLFWQNNYDDAGIGGIPPNSTWEEALSYCEELRLSGYSDWRLPNFNELYTIVNTNKKLPAIDITYTKFVSDYYWSSTTFVNDDKKAWSISFSTGDSRIIDKDLGYVICVRGGK